MRQPWMTLAGMATAMALSLVLAGCEPGGPVQEPKAGGGFNDAGEKNGDWSFTATADTPGSTGKYVNGSMEGLWKFTDAEGVLIKQGHYKNNQPDGEWIFYFEGQESYRGSFSKGKRIGDWKRPEEADAQADAPRVPVPEGNRPTLH